MPLFNRFVMNVDLKRQLTAKDRSGGQITIAQGESALLLFKVFDNGIPYDYTSATNVKIFMKTCSGKNIETDAKIINFENGKAISYEFEKIASVEVGFIQLALAIYEGEYAVHVQPFSIYVYDNLQGGGGSYLELIKSLMDIIDKMQAELINAIPVSEKGQPNGVATLDENGKIPFIQMPDEISAFVEHIEHTVFKDKVHGMQIDEDGILQYFTGTTWQNVGFAPDATGNGGANNVLTATIQVTNGIANVMYIGVPTVISQKYAEGDRNLAYFTLNGQSFEGTFFNVNKEGLHTLWYKDSNGNTYVVLFNVKKEDLPKPIVNIVVDNGVASYNIDRETTIVKYEVGEKDIAYFQNAGVVVTTNSFPVNSTGKYTLYYKLTNGSEYVEVFDVTDDDMGQPIVIINVNNGVATVTYSPSSLTIYDARYTLGVSTKEYFTDGYGLKIVDGTFPVVYADYYTAYLKFTNGVDALGIVKVSESELSSTDSTPPDVNFTVSQLDESTIRIRTVAVDNESKIVKVIFPDNTEESFSNLNTVTRDWTVNSNGTYTFTYINGEGLRTMKSITINTLNEEIPNFIYGFTVDMNNDNPLTSVEYTNGAEAITNWEDVYPFNRIRPCLLNEDGMVITYLDKNDYSKDAYGTPIDNINSLNVMIEIPQFYYNVTVNSNKIYVTIANNKRTSSYENRAFMNGSVLKGKFYVGAYLSNLFDNKLKSLSGKLPNTSFNLTEARTKAMNNGVGYSLVGYNQLLAMQILYVLKYKTLNSQEVLGRGKTRYIETSPDYTGFTDNIGLYSSVQNSDTRSKFLGIEDFYGNAMWWIDGAKLVSGGADKYDFTTSNIPNNFNDAGNSYSQVTRITRTGDINGIVKTVSGSPGAIFLPNEVLATGNTNKNFCDYSGLDGEYLAFGAGIHNGLVENTDYLTGVFSLSFVKNETIKQNNASRIMYL